MLLLFQWSNECWQFDLCVLCLLNIQLEHLEVHGSGTVEAWLGEFEHYFASVCNCAVVWIFFGVAFLWDWNKNWPFPVLWPLLSFPKFLAYWVRTFTASSFRIWNSSTGIPSPPLALFIVMLLRPTWLHIPGCLALGDWSDRKSVV